MKKYKIVKLLYFYTFLILIIVLFLYTFNESTSRYLGKTKTNGNMLAVPVLTLSNNKVPFIADKMFPGDELDFEFYVSNAENGKINEVLFNYYLNIEVGTEIPLTFEIYDITSGMEQKLDIIDGKTKSEEMNYGQETTKHYKLKIKWNKDDNNREYMNKQVKFLLTLKGEQIIK